MVECPECGGQPEQPRVIEVEGDRMTRPGGETCSNPIHAASAASSFEGEKLARLEAVAEAAERYLAASNTLAFRPTKEVETAAAQAHHDLTEALNVVNS